jgi:hypothetical protein
VSALESIAAARREVRRCQSNLDAGGSREFWLKRLDTAARQFEAAAAILRMQIAAMTVNP